MRDIVTVVLAAGRGDRIGGPKALLEWPQSLPADWVPGRPFAAGTSIPLAVAHAQRRIAAESTRAIVVSRKAFIMPLLGFVGAGIDLLASDAEDALGPAGSLAFAMSRLGAPEVVIVTPVDTIPARAETVAALIARLDASPTLLAARPRYHGKGGHPVALRSGALDRYRSPAPPPLRDHLRALGDACVDVDVDDPTVVVDLDRPSDVAHALGGMPKFFPFRKV